MGPEERATIRHPALVTLAFQLARSNATTFSHVALRVKAFHTVGRVRSLHAIARKTSKRPVNRLVFPATACFKGIVPTNMSLHARIAVIIT
jgi:hypothetical protein